MSWELAAQHLYIVLASSLASILVGLPLGVLAYLYPKARPVILWIMAIYRRYPII